MEAILGLVRRFLPHAIRMQATLVIPRCDSNPPWSGNSFRALRGEGVRQPIESTLTSENASTLHPTASKPMKRLIHVDSMHMDFFGSSFRVRLELYGEMQELKLGVNSCIPLLHNIHSECTLWPSFEQAGSNSNFETWRVLNGVCTCIRWFPRGLIKLLRPPARCPPLFVIAFVYHVFSSGRLRKPRSWQPKRVVSCAADLDWECIG